MKRFIKIISAVGLVLLGTPQAHAFGAVSGHVIQVRVDKQGQGMVVFDAQITQVSSGPLPSLLTFCNCNTPLRRKK